MFDKSDITHLLNQRIKNCKYPIYIVIKDECLNLVRLLIER